MTIGELRCAPASGWTHGLHAKMILRQFHYVTQMQWNAREFWRNEDEDVDNHNRTNKQNDTSMTLSQYVPLTSLSPITHSISHSTADNTDSVEPICRYHIYLH